MAQVNPFAETQRGNGAPPPDDDGHGLLVPMIHSINQQLRDVRDLASQAATEAQLSRIEGRELRGEVRGIRNGLFVFLGAFLFTVFLFGFLYLVFR